MNREERRQRMSELRRCRWIPVTERLPENGDRRKFLLRVKWHDDVYDESLECVDYLQYFWRDGKWYDVEDDEELNDFYTVIAWMPLPESYKKETEDAEPERKRGKWIYDGTKRVCPFCKDFIVTGRSIVKYCWNCGARLKERSEDAES